MKPFLKWVGGKYKLLPQLVPLLPNLEHVHTYIEPFLGSGAMFFALEFDEGDRVVLGDQNFALVDTYRCVRDCPEMVLRFLAPIADGHRGNTARYYKVVRSTFNSGRGSPTERAAMFLYLNRTCFNGVWRVNSEGKFNVPIGDYEKPVIYNQPAIEAASARLTNPVAVLRHQDFGLTVVEAVVSTPRPGKEAFVYLDPPYVPVSATADFTSYTVDRFDRNDLVRLVETCHRIHRAGAKFMLSNSNAPAVREAFKAYNIVEVTRRGSINSDTKKRAPVTELVVRNYG